MSVPDALFVWLASPLGRLDATDDMLNGSAMGPTAPHDLFQQSVRR